LLVTLDSAGSGYDDEQLSQAYQQLLGRLGTIPGVRSATICAVSPISGAGANRGVTVEDYQSKPGEIPNVMENWVAPKYFETLGTPLVAGRDFSFQDQGHPRVAIINETMSRYYFGKSNPIGRDINFDGDSTPYNVVGVVGDAKYLDIREDIYRTIYLNVFQEKQVPSRFVLRTGIDPEAVAPDVRRTVRDMLPTVTVGRIITLEDQVDGTMVPERLIALLSGFFGTLAPMLTAIGLYGLLAYTVVRRTNEIGVRMALGASRSDIARMVVVDALAMVLAGLVIGAPIAFWGSTFAGSLIQGLPTQSAVSIILSVLAMVAVALVAAFYPARRATRIDPLKALRYE
jgi:predicted permease